MRKKYDREAMFEKVSESYELDLSPVAYCARTNFPIKVFYRYRQQYIKRTKIDLATGETVSNKEAKAARMKKVQCGYCGQRGHTRRTCKLIKHDKQV